MTKKPKKPATPIKTYAKVPLSVDDALSHLWQRRLMIDDRSNNARALRSIGYFRLHIYMRRFQNAATKQFWPRTRFTDIVELYDFDRRLRSVTMNAIERVEVALRSALSLLMAAIGMPTAPSTVTCVAMPRRWRRSAGNARRKRGSHSPTITKRMPCLTCPPSGSYASILRLEPSRGCSRHSRSAIGRWRVGTYGRTFPIRYWCPGCIR